MNFLSYVERNGIILTLYHYGILIKSIIFGIIFFGRSDIHVKSTSQLSGVKDMEIGKNFRAGCGLWMETITSYGLTGQKFSPKLIIGNRVNVGEYVHIGCNNRIVIGDDVLMGSKIYITDHNHGDYRGNGQDSPYISPCKRNLTEGKCVAIGDRCWIGEYVTILPGVRIGEGCVIGSHSTVTHDIPANSIAVGSPAKVIKQWNEKNHKWENVKVV